MVKDPRKRRYISGKKAALDKVKEMLGLEGATEEHTVNMREILIFSFTLCFRSTNSSFHQCMKNSGPCSSR